RRFGLHRPISNKPTPSRETWEWRAEKGWTELKPKGKPVARVNGKAVWCSARRCHLVTGGTVAKRDSEAPVTVTEEFDGSDWFAFETRTANGEPTPAFRELAYDPHADQAFGIAAEAAKLILYSYASLGGLPEPELAHRF